MVHESRGPSAAFAQHRERVAALGRALTPEMIQGSVALCAKALDPGLMEGVRTDYDVSYGAHERHVLDVYSGADTATGTSRPVVVYVHGGGFVAGAKSAEGSPFFGNIGGWAVRNGYVAIALNYRLAPESTWPSGAQDIAAALTWVVEHVSGYGGDPERIFLVGQSAGAMHAADYLVRPELHGPHGRALAGAALISCLYDVGRAQDKPMHRAYWGDDLEAWKGMGSLEGLIETDLPLLLAVAEYDDPEFHAHAAQLVTTWHERRNEYPPMHYLYGQNHLTTAYAIGTGADTLGPLLTQYVDAGAGPSEGGRDKSRPPSPLT